MCVWVCVCGCVCVCVCVFININILTWDSIGYSDFLFVFLALMRGKNSFERGVDATKVSAEHNHGVLKVRGVLCHYIGQ